MFVFNRENEREENNVLMFLWDSMVHGDDSDHPLQSWSNRLRKDERKKERMENERNGMEPSHGTGLWSVSAPL